MREIFDPKRSSISSSGMTSGSSPLGPRTRISYTVPAAEEPVRLDIYDVAGRLVRVLVNGVQEPGVHQVEWDGTDASGVPVASGAYLYRLQTGRLKRHVSKPVDPTAHFVGKPVRFAVVLPCGAVRRVGVRTTIPQHDHPSTITNRASEALT